MTPGAEAVSDVIGRLSETDRQALLQWVGHIAIEARVDEINQFAIAGQAEELHSVAQIQAYFVGRVVVLAEQMEALEGGES